MPQSEKMYLWYVSCHLASLPVWAANTPSCCVPYATTLTMPTSRSPPPLFPLSFLRLWIAVLVIYPTNQAVIALTFSNYVLQPLFPTCFPPESGLRLLAAVCLCEWCFFFTFSKRKWCAKTQWQSIHLTLFTFKKKKAHTQKLKDKIYKLVD